MLSLLLSSLLQLDEIARCSLSTALGARDAESAALVTIANLSGAR